MIRAWHRPLAALWALWFFVVTTGAGELGACKVHGPGHGGHASSAAMTGTTASAHQHDAPVDTHDTHRVAVAPDEQEHAPASCSCVGDCCMITPAALPTPPVLELSAAASAARTPTPEYRSVIALRRAFAQPYAIGPPTNSTT